MKKYLVVLLLGMLLLVTVSCGAPSAMAPAPMPAPTPAPMPAPAPPPAAGPDSYYRGESPPPPSPEEAVYEGEERMIIRTGEVSLVVDDVIEAMDEIAQVVEELGGYVVSSRVYGEETERRGRISIRVPDDKFDLALTELRDLAVRVESESTDSQDVTEEYIDLQARLNNAEATENQYLALLDKAEAVEDILKIYDSLSRVRNEIEQIKGRMQYLERTTSMSFISVRLEPAATAKGLVQAGWSALEVLKSAVRGIVIFGQWLGNIAIWLLIFTPVWGAIAGIIYWRLRRKKKKAKEKVAS